MKKKEARKKNFIEKKVLNVELIKVSNFTKVFV